MSTARLAGDVRELYSARVDGSRLIRTIESLSLIGADPAGGISRLGLTSAEGAGRELVAGIARSYGLQTETDAAANLIIRRSRPDPGRPVLLLGSHLDTVVQGGALDGAYGLLAALEVLRAVSSCDLDSTYEPVVIGFSNEEGAWIPCPFWGSKAVTGQLVEPELLKVRDGRSIRQALHEAGGNFDRLGTAQWPAGSIGCYLELHIEQGSTLETAGVPLGIVSAVTGRTVVAITVDGEQNHAGTTPMPARRDALAAAARIVLALEGMARDERRCAVATVGILEVDSGSTNVIPGRVRLTAEFRDPVQRNLDRAELRMVEQLAAIADSCGVEVAHQVTMRRPPSSCDPALLDRIATAAHRLAAPTLTMHSGAGHDSQIIADQAPIGMIFVPSRGGMSHCPQEHTPADQLVLGADLLLQSVLATLADPIGPAAAGCEPLS
ncbi:Zn-dependent hydrolase [Jatrophihabitans sp.]|jgi:N-carbamoyl-L-amino-acid hydrolase|uniref:Zn-dependent hydrolase n=1 Tax=Jatrophihabitans sp. TaxID=1932789 RepID=UPI002F15FDC4